MSFSFFFWKCPTTASQCCKCSICTTSTCTCGKIEEKTHDMCPPCAMEGGEGFAWQYRTCCLHNMDLTQTWQLLHLALSWLCTCLHVFCALYKLCIFWSCSVVLVSYKKKFLETLKICKYMERTKSFIHDTQLFIEHCDYQVHHQLGIIWKYMLKKTVQSIEFMFTKI